MPLLKRNPGGRPRSLAALSPAERMRRYRARLRARGLRMATVKRRDPVAARVRFGRGSLLTPGEQDVLRHFCAGFRRLPAMPVRAAVFGSRARGTSGARSDLDVAVFFDSGPSAEVDAGLAAIAFAAQTPYREADFGIFLKPVAIHRAERGTFLQRIRRDLEVIWTKPD